MNPSGLFTASLLDSSARAFAAGSVSRMTDLQDESSLLDYWPFGEVVADTEIRVRNLAEAFATGRPEVFHLDVHWLQATYAARGVPVGMVATTLKCLRDELVDSLPEQSQGMAREYLESAIAAAENTPGQDESLLEPGAPMAELSQKFLLAVLEARRPDAEQLIQEALDGGASVNDLHLQVIAPAQAEIGRMWQAGEASIAEEHLGSRIVEDVLAFLRSRMPRASQHGRRVIVASVSGNLHDIGARMVSDHFEMAGWNALFLGADMPGGDLVGILKEFKAQLLALSVGLGLNLRATAQMIETIREACPGVSILVGGRPFSLIPDLWKDVGADGWAADASSAVAEGNRLAG